MTTCSGYLAYLSRIGMTEDELKEFQDRQADQIFLDVMYPEAQYGGDGPWNDYGGDYDKTVPMLTLEKLTLTADAEYEWDGEF